jgi:hypothetical protein
MDSKIIIIICLVAGVSVLATVVTINETKSPEEKIMAIRAKQIEHLPPIPGGMSQQAHNACIDDMDTDWKISFTFEMIMDGQKAEVQPNIGITDECQRAIYTLSNDGTVYAEWIENPDFELGHFLYISKFKIRDMEESKTEVYVNDRLAENGLRTPLQDKYHYKVMFTSKT